MSTRAAVVPSTLVPETLHEQPGNRWWRASASRQVVEGLWRLGGRKRLPTHLSWLVVAVVTECEVDGVIGCWRAWCAERAGRSGLAAVAMVGNGRLPTTAWTRGA